MGTLKSIGNNQRNLTRPGHDRNPSWSPDGKRIAFESNRDGNWEIYVMNANGRNQRRLTNNPALDFSPVWFDPAAGHPVSPAGKLRVLWGWIKQK